MSLISSKTVPGTPMVLIRTPAAKKRRAKKLRREEERWAARSGPVITSTAVRAGLGTGRKDPLRAEPSE